MLALPLSHTPTIILSYNTERVCFLFCFWFWCILSPSTSHWTQLVLYMTWFLPPNKWTSLVSAYKMGQRDRYPWFTFPYWDFKNCFPKADSIWNRSLSKLTAAHILQYWLLFPCLPKSLNLQTTFLSPPLRVCVSLSISLYIHFSSNSQHWLLKNINRQWTVHQH